MKYSPDFFKGVSELLVDESLPEFKTPISLSLIRNMRQAIADKGIVPTHMVLGAGAWSILFSDATINSIITASSNVKDAEIGYVGNAFGLDILSEAFTADEERKLPTDFLGILAIDSKHCSTWGSNHPTLKKLYSVQTLIGR